VEFQFQVPKTIHLQMEGSSCNTLRRKWEGIGFLLIVGGMLYGMASSADSHIGGIAAAIGFVIFIVGRFK